MHPSKYILFTLFILCVSCSKNSKPLAVAPFQLSDVTLLSGPFKHATDLNIKTLLNYEPDRFLSRFRSNAGLQPKAEHYAGWESETIAGFSLGHFLSANAMMYQTTNDKRFLKRVKYIVKELAACQAVDSSGYIGAIPNGRKIFEDEIAKGDIKAQPFSLNGLWAPFYTHHKVMAGLRDAYHLCAVEDALSVEIKFADWISTIVEKLNPQQIQEMLSCEHGGINEVLVDLYVDTQDEKYLQLSKTFHHKAVLDSLSAGFDILPGKHGNTQIPKLIGLTRRYETTADLNDKNAALFFWKRVVQHHSYVTGGHGNHEYFGPADHLSKRLSDETTETCNVYNMLKLSRHLFQWSPKAEIADYYERALFNHILSSQNPDDGRVIYNLSLEMGGYKHYEDPFGFTCCIGTAMETHSKYGRNIFFKNDHALYISQFIAARAQWQEKGISITQSTQFPKEQGTTIHFDYAEAQEFTLFIRYPYWAENGIDIQVNGEVQQVNQRPGTFVSIKRTWHGGDKVDVRLPFSLRLEGMPDDTNRVAIMYGPLLLAGDLGPVDDPAAADPNYVPQLRTEERDPNVWLKPVANQSNTFEVIKGFADPHGFNLKPFYSTHQRRYSVYWDMYNAQRWQQHQKDLKAKLTHQKELEAKTVDFFQPGDLQSEESHNFKGERIRVKTFRHKMARVTDRGGWFSFEMHTSQTAAKALVVDYWGGFTGSKTFDILIDNQKIAQENISGKQDGEFINVKYDIAAELISGKDKIKITFYPHEGHRAGPLFGARLIRK